MDVLLLCSQGRPVQPLPKRAWDTALTKLRIQAELQVPPSSGGAKNERLKLPRITDGDIGLVSAMPREATKRRSLGVSCRSFVEGSDLEGPMGPSNGLDSGAESDDTDILIGVRVSKVASGSHLISFGYYCHMLVPLEYVGAFGSRYILSLLKHVHVFWIV